MYFSACFPEREPTCVSQFSSGGKVCESPARNSGAGFHDGQNPSFVSWVEQKVGEEFTGSEQYNVKFRLVMNSCV